MSTCLYKSVIMSVLYLLIHFQLLQGCDVIYVKEPPEGIHCNPYAKDASLVLECQVHIPASASFRAKLSWIFRDFNQINHKIDSSNFPPLSNNIQHSEGSGDSWLLYHKIILAGSAMIPQMHSGLYFCQVFLDNTNETTLLPSSKLALEMEDGPSFYFNEHPCWGDSYYRNTIRCAGNISTSVSELDSTWTMLNQQTGSYDNTSTASPISVMDTSVTDFVTDESETHHMEIWMYAVAGLAATIGLCGISILLGILWLGHKIKTVKTVDMEASSPTNINISQDWRNESSNVTRKTRVPMKFSINEAYEATSEPVYVEIV